MTAQVSIRLSFSKTKHLLCRAKINGQSARLLIDTGASSSCIDSSLKDHFALHTRGEPFDAAGASEGKMHAIMTTKCILQLGNNFKGKQAFVLLDLSHVNLSLSSQGVKKIDGIIGADSLKKNKAIIDYSQRKLFL